MLLLELTPLSSRFGSFDFFYCGFCITGLDCGDGFTGGRVLDWEAFMEQVSKLNGWGNENEW
jgi:hypothetical protein